MPLDKMYFLFRLESPVEVADCDVAVVEISSKLLDDLTLQAKALMMVHILDQSVYRIEFWGNTMEVYPDSLCEALKEKDPKLMAPWADEYPDSVENPIILPDDFEIPAGCEEQPTELMTTEVSHAVDWDDEDKIEVQFSCVVKHTSAELRTHSTTLGELRVRHMAHNARRQMNKYDGLP